MFEYTVLQNRTHKKLGSVFATNDGEAYEMAFTFGHKNFHVTFDKDSAFNKKQQLKGEWYPFGERDNPTLRPRIIDGRRFFRGRITTIKAEAEKSAESFRKRGHFARIIPLTLWGKRRGYEIPDKRQCYVVYHSHRSE